MATIKGTLIFRGTDHGWTESYFWSGTNNLNFHTPILDFIAQKRAALLGNDCEVRARRVSIELDDANNPVRGDAQLRRKPVYFGNPDQPAAAPGTGLQLRFENAAGTNHKNLFMRGIWDVVETTDGQYQPGAGAGWGGAMAAFISALLGASGANVGWIARGPLSPANAQVVDYVEEDSGQITFTASAGAFTGPMVGTRRHIRISGINAPTKSVLNREWVVDVLSTDSARTIVPVSAFPFLSPGKLTVYGFVLVVAANILEEGIIFRSVGRPLLVRRGRQARRPLG